VCFSEDKPPLYTNWDEGEEHKALFHEVFEEAAFKRGNIGSGFNPKVQAT